MLSSWLGSTLIELEFMSSLIKKSTDRPIATSLTQQSAPFASREPDRCGTPEGLKLLKRSYSRYPNELWLKKMTHSPDNGVIE
ncbi:hypothetical protein BI308_11275 [Roseofilum reptotaenium AO1-A]|uniref:Uncharacterized protein n=1 Tax=Roseofilum reptotaenium AO1-A TaxID=1925591 RepID=A0A1L9QS87_9CYAN|nr:hypothetical protein BI308_11275 [Roseofilum reptotaenium AO1-A]